MEFKNIVTVLLIIIFIVFMILRFFGPRSAWEKPSRAGRENKFLGSWKYSPAQWAGYSNTCFKNLKNVQLRNSKEEVTVEIRSKYITLKDSSTSIPLTLDGKCVRTIDCSILNNMLTVCVRARIPNNSTKGEDKFRKVITSFPIPVGSENEAQQVVAYFRTLIQEEADNIAQLYPPDESVKLFEQ